MEPLVSVVVPTWNRGNYLREALLSIASQTYPRIETVIVDNESTDDTPAVIAAVVEETRDSRGPDWIRYSRQKHSLIPVARNKGIELASGDLIAFLDSDDVLESDKLEKQVAYLQAHPEAEIVFCLYENVVDNEGEPTQEELELLSEHRTPYGMLTSVIRKELFDRCGAFSPELAVGEDSEWIARAGHLGVDMDHLLEEELYRRRVHAGNISLKGGNGSSESARPEANPLSFIAAGIRNARRRRRDGHAGIGSDPNV
ncbi:MAG: glycosyltransferase [Atopobiaceae bacterium]|nr:glycosyltransferase [Atopobiaceae bacterium]